MRSKKQAKDGKTMAKMLRKFIAGEDIIEEGIDWGERLSVLTTEELKTLLAFQQGKTVDPNEIQRIEQKLKAKPQPKKFTWFNTEQIIHDDPDDPFSENRALERRPSWWREYDKGGSEPTPKPALTPQQVVDPPPKKSIVQRVHEFFAGDSKPSNSESIETTEVSEEAIIVPLNGLQAKLAEMEKEFANNLEAHNRNEVLKRANSDLNVHIEKILRV